MAANATERAVRGESRSANKDGIYRAALRGDSKYMRAKADAVAKGTFVSGAARPEPGKRTLLETRDSVLLGWHSVANKLASQGDRKLAAEVVDFVAGLAPPLTAQERIARALQDFVPPSQRLSRVR